MRLFYNGSYSAAPNYMVSQYQSGDWLDLLSKRTIQENFDLDILTCRQVIGLFIAPENVSELDAIYNLTTASTPLISQKDVIEFYNFFQNM